MADIFSGKTALVTGASRGIGAAVARRIAAAGGHVAVNFARNAEAAEAVVEAIRQSGGQAFAVQADVGSSDSIRRMFETVDARFGREGEAPFLDFLVNNAGQGSDGTDQRLGRATEVAFDRMVAVNARGPFFVSQEAMPRLRSGGRLVNIGSIAGRVAQPYSPAYAMTKRALQSLTMSLAQALASRQITANLVAPGAVDTDFIAALAEKPGWLEAAAKNTPFGRIGTPDDIAGAVMMLLSNDAGWVTGQIIEAGGGLQL